LPPVRGNVTDQNQNPPTKTADPIVVRAIDPNVLAPGERRPVEEDRRDGRADADEAEIERQDVERPGGFHQPRRLACEERRLRLLDPNPHPALLSLIRAQSVTKLTALCFVAQAARNPDGVRGGVLTQHHGRL